jgi:hypothetical protein
LNVKDGRRKTEGGSRKADEGRIDLAIDGAVREMLDVEPPAGLRARVIAQIEESHPASAFDSSHVASAFRRKFAFSRRLWWIAAPLTGAAIILLAVLLPHRDTNGPLSVPASPTVARGEPTTGLPPTASRQAPAGAEQAHSPATRATAPRVVTDGAVRPPRRGRAERPGSRAIVTATGAEAATVDVAPLRSMSPIAVAAVRPPALEDQEIAITPLRTIADVQVAPLSPPDRRH